MTRSPELTGGAGFTFEDLVNAVYLSSLLTESTPPGVNGYIAEKIALQQADFGEPLDDLIVDCRTSLNQKMRLSIQIKRQLTISAAKRNKDFRDIIINANATMQNKDFRNDVDRVGVITGTISDSVKRELETVCEWAKSSISHIDFMKRFLGLKENNKKYQNIRDIQSIISDVSTPDMVDKQVYNLLRHFIIIKLDLEHEGAKDEVNAINNLSNCLHSKDSNRANDLWSRLRQIASDGRGRAAQFDRPALLNRLNMDFRIKGSINQQHNLNILINEAKLALSEINKSINDNEIPRPQILKQAKDNLIHYSFIQITGLQGTGKSVIFRNLAEEYLANGPIIVIKANRLEGVNWFTYARYLGLDSSELESLLVEIASTGTPILFIDGIDRIENSCRSIIIDLFNVIYKSSLLLNKWRVVATLRNGGLEDLLTWLPINLIENNIATVEVDSFNDKEAKTLAETMPSLTPLLFSDDENVREISRRPFFASVIARNIGLNKGNFITPKSEIDLLIAWWENGDPKDSSKLILHRQRTLIQLAKAGAATLGRHIKLDGLDTDIIDDLQSNGILNTVKSGHTVKFANDIFFEWSFVHLLIERENSWIEEIQSVGEPHILSRVVELLSQDKYLNNDHWAENLKNIEQSKLRSQWLRNWLIGPLGIPNFLSQSNVLNDVALKDNNYYLRKFVVWFQAEKVKANPHILNGTCQIEFSNNFEKIRYADIFAWPSDIALWKRCCTWLLNITSHCEIITRSEILPIFEIWQNVFADIPNEVSTLILENIQAWLEQIEEELYNEQFPYDKRIWSKPPGSVSQEFEEKLRNLFLRSARVRPEAVKAYLTRIQTKRPYIKTAFAHITLFSPLLSECFPEDLVTLSSITLKKDLPVDVQKHNLRKTFHSFSFYDWQTLSISKESYSFYPPSPLREPFYSLFQKAPTEALRLVHELTNHAITAWRQLYELDSRHHLIPLEVTLDFPWGKQIFWGNGNVYQWFRAYDGPNDVATGLMSLEQWAFSEAEKGRDIDSVIHDIISGCECCAVLGIAVSLALTYKRVSDTTLPLVTCQRLWQWDIYRLIQDTLKPNIMGFSSSHDPKHLKAVHYSNNRISRSREIRELVPLFVFSEINELSQLTINSIKTFPENLPFEYEEQRQDENYNQEIFRKAKLWAEYSKKENYKLYPLEDKNYYQIIFNNPEAKRPDVVAITKKHKSINEYAVLLAWAHKFFESKLLGNEISLRDAINSAKALDLPNLFKGPQGVTVEIDNLCTAVAGIAAVALNFQDNLENNDIIWAKGVIFRAAVTPEQLSDTRFPESIISYHPCIYAIHGLINLIKNNIEVLKAKQALIKITGHVLEQISLTALGAIFDLWSIDPAFAWSGLDLGIRLSINTKDSQQETIIKNLDITLRQLEKKDSKFIRLSHISFELNSGQSLRYNFLSKVLYRIPIKQIMSNSVCFPIFLTFCDELNAWTLKKLIPSRDEDDEDEFHYNSSNLYEWQISFFHFLAQVFIYNPVDETRKRFLDPIFFLKDKITLSLLSPFVHMLMSHIMDTPTINSQIIETMKICVTRVLQCDNWKYARQQNGRIYGFDLPDIVQIFLFIKIEHAGSAARFANANWSDIGIVLSIIDLFVCSVGDIPIVMNAFLTLCEKAVNYFPVEQFVKIISTVLKKQNGSPIGWRGTSIPSKIATLIQILGEKIKLSYDSPLAKQMLEILDVLVDMGDRRAAVLLNDEIFKRTRII